MTIDEMTLEEAIKHAEEVAEELEEEAVKGCCDDTEIMDKCIECAKEHRQLAEWLKELKKYREADEEIRSLSQVWEEGEGINKCCRIIDKHLEEVIAYENKKSFPCIEGELAEMYVNGKWIKGKIVKGYRFDDGVVTIKDNNGKQYWCGQDRTDLYRPCEEVNADD